MYSLELLMLITASKSIVPTHTCAREFVFNFRQLWVGRYMFGINIPYLKIMSHFYVCHERLDMRRLNEIYALFLDYVANYICEIIKKLRIFL